MIYHGLLDWRLGISILQSFQTDDYRCGLDGNFLSPELADWPALAERLRDSFVRSFGVTPQDFGPLPGAQVGHREVIVVHPLWNTVVPRGLLAEAIATAADQPYFLDTFNLLRRESWSYRSLNQQFV
jgi:DEAD/DEAH box helicase domain-containing protein